MYSPDVSIRARPAECGRDEIAALVDQAVGVETEQLHTVELTTTDLASDAKHDAVWSFVLRDVFEVFDDLQKHREDLEDLCLPLERFPGNPVEPHILREQIGVQPRVVRQPPPGSGAIKVGIRRSPCSATGLA